MRIFELLNPDAQLNPSTNSPVGTMSMGNMSAPTSTTPTGSNAGTQMADAGTPMGPDSTFNKMLGNNDKADSIANAPFGSNSQSGLGGNFFQNSLGKPPIPLQ